MASRRGRGATAQGPNTSTTSISETLSRLGMTQEQFQAKQAELLTVLLQNQPFVPQNANTTRTLTELERSSSGRTSAGRSRSGSISSTSSRATSPAFPRTPSRSNQAELALSRPRDQMELILEARNRRKERQQRGSMSRSREDERVFSTPSRASEQPQASQLPPETPHHYRYYSERVVGEASFSKRTLDDTTDVETPSRTRGRFKVPAPRYPKTPSRKKVAGRSSCPVTPRSSPPPVVDLVSSPGPMQPDPPDEDHLPFRLPSGPYSETKPDIPYAAIIGRAIVASPNHALALQDIYEYITTVYPYYKRGEVTWMNSVRHALSTMAVFRKVARGRAEGKSLWAIYDCDLPCFEGGGFKKHLCADMSGQPSRPRKRAADDGGGPRTKRKKSGEEHAGSQSVAIPAPVLPPYFPHFAHTNPHHQSYYQAALQQHQPAADTLFPPLPPSSNYHRVIRAASIPTVDAVPDAADDESPIMDAGAESEADLVPSSPIERPPSSSSIPDLISNLSSSSSPAPSSHPSLCGEGSVQPSPTPESIPLPTVDLPVEDAMAVWFRSNAPSKSHTMTAEAVVYDVKGKGKARLRTPPKSAEKYPRMLVSMGPPSSPTPAKRKTATCGAGYRKSSGCSPATARPTTPILPQTNVGDAIYTKQTDSEAIRTRSTLLHPALVASALASADGCEEDLERPSTPDRPVTPPPPSTPVHSDLPSTPSGLAQLESELFDFSPCKSGGRTQTRLTPMLPQSPSLSVFNSRAPLLRMGSIDDFLAADPPPFPTRSPAMPPRTPKKSPIVGGPSTAHSMRVASPFGTPSRMPSRHHSKDGEYGFEDDLAKWFSSPYGALPGGTEACSPSGLGYW